MNNLKITALYGLDTSQLVLKKRSKVKTYHKVVLRTQDRKFEISFDEDYTGTGVETTVKLYWRGLIPFMLTASQKVELVEIVHNFLSESVYGKNI